MVPQRKFRVVVQEGEMDSWQTIQQCSLQLEIAYFCPVYPFYSLYHKLSVKCLRNGNFYGKVCSLLLKDHLHCKHFLRKKSRGSRARKCIFHKCVFPSELHPGLKSVKTAQIPGPNLLLHSPDLPYGFRGYICLQNPMIWKTLHFKGI